MTEAFKLLIVIFVAAISVTAGYIEHDTAVLNCEYWVAPPPQGDDANPGTFNQPWATLEHAAVSIPDNSCTVWFMDGTYLGENLVKERYTTFTSFRAINSYQAILENNGPVLAVHGARNVLFEGFEFRHASPVSGKHVVEVNRRNSTGLWSENITLRNNIFHDSYNNDLLKVFNGSRFVTVENNVFYNQGPNDQHMDVNSVTDVVIQDNIFFNDFAGSGRTNPGDTKHFIIIKDSNGNDDGLEGSERVTVRRNIFLNWEGGVEKFVKVGNDGKPYHEAKSVLIENNLMIGNSSNKIGAAFGVDGARDVTFRNNTIVGDLPSKAYAFRVDTKGENPKNENIFFYNNIWSDPTGTMGSDGSGSSNEFSDGDPAETINLILDNNLYWNGSELIPDGDLVSPLIDDGHRLVTNPGVQEDHQSIILPRWNGSSFISGSNTIRQEFIRLAQEYARIPFDSSAVSAANPTMAPSDDILGRPRTESPDMGAYEYIFTLWGISDLTSIWLFWTPPSEPEAVSLTITYTTGVTTEQVSGIPVSTRTYHLEDLTPYSLYIITLTAHDSDGAIVAQSNTLLLITTNLRINLPFVADG